MEILIKIRDKKIRVILLNNRKETDFVNIQEERNLSEKLLPEISCLLERNKLHSQDIAKIQMDSDQGETFTTTRIAKTVADVWSWTVKL